MQFDQTMKNPPAHGYTGPGASVFVVERRRFINLYPLHLTPARVSGQSPTQFFPLGNPEENRAKDNTEGV